MVGGTDKLRRETGTTFIVVEHRLDLLVRIADRIVVMNEGKKVMDGKTSDVLSDERAEGYGLAVPAVVRVTNALSREGISFGRPAQSPVELAAEVNSGVP